MDNNKRKNSDSDGSATKRRRNGDETEEKRKERLEANRIAAYNCRLRKKILIDELQKQVTELSNKMGSLERENQSLRKQLGNIRNGSSSGSTTGCQQSSRGTSPLSIDCQLSNQQQMLVNALHQRSRSNMPSFINGHPVSNVLLSRSDGNVSPLSDSGHNQQLDLNTFIAAQTSGDSAYSRPSNESLHMALGQHLDNLIARQRQLILQQQLSAQASLSDASIGSTSL